MVLRRLKRNIAKLVRRSGTSNMRDTVGGWRKRRRSAEASAPFQARSSPAPRFVTLHQDSPKELLAEVWGNRGNVLRSGAANCPHHLTRAIRRERALDRDLEQVQRYPLRTKAELGEPGPKHPNR